MTTPSRQKAKAKTIDSYLKTVSPDQRKALEKLRQEVRLAAPGAEECISYGIPGFRWKGKFLVGFGAAAKHCAFYPGSIVREFAKELARYDTAKGTIRFQPENPLPKALVQKLVKARIAEQTGAKDSD